MVCVACLQQHDIAHRINVGKLEIAACVSHSILGLSTDSILCLHNHVTLVQSHAGSTHDALHIHDHPVMQDLLTITAVYGLTLQSKMHAAITRC